MTSVNSSLVPGVANEHTAVLSSNRALRDAFKRIEKGVHFSSSIQAASGYDDLGLDPYEDDVYVDCPYEDSIND